ncbi:MAG: L,D-transpeptidase family protein [Lachnospiraceae bacterium]
MEHERNFKSRKKKGSAGKIVAAVCCVLAAAGVIAGGVYWYLGRQYTEVFFPNTTINGVDASRKTVDEVKELISAGIDGYTLTLEGRDGTSEVITKEEIGLYSVFDGTMEELLTGQQPGHWLLSVREDKGYTIETMIAYDEELFEKRLSELSILDETQMTAPENASISQYHSDTGYSVVPETKGTQVDAEKVKAAVSDAILNLSPTLSLEESGCYIEAEITKEDQRLKDAVDTLNRYAGVTISHRFGERYETIGGDQISKWLSVSEDYQVSISREGVAEYVKTLADKYDTYNKAKNLKTSYGKTVKITKGFYGWKINQSAETDAVLSLIQAGETATREPVYSQKANSHGENDYGDTYVEINLTAQHLYFYKDGKLIVESDFVSGNLSKGYDTPGGAYPLTYKQKGATLRGEDYNTPVDYWMPFNGNIGMHDAGWRSSFGGTIYKKSGSHGCINMPPANAKKVFENISAGDPVLCYFLEGTEQGKTSKPKPEETTAAETKAPETTAAETKAPETTAPETTAPETTVPETSPAESTASESQPVITTPEESSAAETESSTAATEESSRPNGPGEVDIRR